MAAERHQQQVRLALTRYASMLIVSLNSLQLRISPLMVRRFVILKHDHPFLHWDLLLEEESSARTWRLLRKPCLLEPIPAEPLPPHRLMYLDYEGPVSGNRGSVERVLKGTYAEELSNGEIRRLRLSECSFASMATVQTLSDDRVFVTFSAGD